MEKPNAAVEDWVMLRQFFPADWEALGERHGAAKGLRQDKSLEAYLRVLLLHIGCGFSLRETAVRAEQAGLAELSDVALLKRLRKSKAWLHALCEALFAERTAAAAVAGGRPLRLVDSTLVQEPGQTGSQWRLHYSLSFPGLSCDYFKLTPVAGRGHGESLRQYPLRAGEHVLADRGYCRAQDLHYAAARQARTLVRLNTGTVRLQTAQGAEFPLLARLAELSATDQPGEWPVWVPLAGAAALPLRLCALRKSQVAIARTLKKLRRKASINGTTPQPATLRCAEFVLVLTSFAATEYTTAQVLECYRFRWQIELLFKRLKQLAQLGHLPKHDDDSAQAWLYGKLFVALLTEKLVGQARAFSPWGYPLGAAG